MLPGPFAAGASISGVSVGPKGLPTRPKIPGEYRPVTISYVFASRIDVS
jgi:hypothetical protein